MSEVGLLFVVWMLVTIVAMWQVAPAWRSDLVGLSSALFLAVVSPISAAWLLSSSLITQQVMARYGERSSVVIASTVALIAGSFLILRALSQSEGSLLGTGFAMTGVAYYTCRHIHALLDCWFGRLAPPPLRGYLHYQFFGPVLIVGPIHRYQNFAREIRERSWSSERFFAGAERALHGAALAIVVGSYLLAEKLGVLLAPWTTDDFFGHWLGSALEWAVLYAQFSGFSDMVIGLALMSGIKVEENFNNPLKATGLIDFWMRWHMTLSRWCRDYVYVPVAALSRSPLLGVLLAMLAMGIWHETSLYYVLWAAWQAFGIAINRFYQTLEDPLRLGVLPAPLSGLVCRLLVFGWLTAARPVILEILAFLPS